mgnify:CR=1 FL=1
MSLTKLIIDVSTGETQQVTVTDAELIATRAKYLFFAFDDATNTLSAQLQSCVLSDDTRANVSDIQTWRVMIGDVETDITTDANGAWSDTVSFVDGASYDVYAIEPDNSNRITIQDII